MAGSTLSALVRAYMRRHNISPEMEQNLIKEALHHHILSALSDTGITERVVFQGGTSLRLCYSGTRYSEDLDFVCGRGGGYLNEIDFQEAVDKAIDILSASLSEVLGIDKSRIRSKPPKDTDSLRGEKVSVAAWQIAVPIDDAPSAPASRVKIEFANVPSHDVRVMMVKAPDDLIQTPSIILRVESPTEILADKVIALINRPYLKYRDVWDVNFIETTLRHEIDRSLLWDLVCRKLSDYRISDLAHLPEKLSTRIAGLQTRETLDGYKDEISRFIPGKQVEQILRANLHAQMLADSVRLLEEAKPEIEQCIQETPKP